MFYEYEDSSVANLIKYFIVQVREEGHDNGRELQRIVRNRVWISHTVVATFFRDTLDPYYEQAEQKKILEDLLDKMPNFEHISRDTRRLRKKLVKEGKLPSPKQANEVPAWYDEYIRTSYFDGIRDRSIKSWNRDGRLHCVVQARHGFEEMHHNDYGRLGSSDEWLSLYPYCRDCHKRIRKYGPGLPTNPPEAVARLLG